MILNVLSWILIGFLAGVFVGKLFPSKGEYRFGILGSAIIGALVGGVLYSGLKIGSISYSLDFVSFILALGGSIFLMALISLLIKNENEDEKNRARRF